MSAIDLTPFGLAVGHATDAAGGTGCTVVRGVDAPLRAGVAVLGRATGTRELALLAPGHLVDRVDALLLTGGSAYGLDAAAGVMRWMEERGHGFPVGGGVVPIVPAAVIFDLAPCGRFDARPTPAMAYDACDRARPVVDAQGSVGAATGATVGKLLGPAGAMKGGFGAAVVGEGDGACAALVVVNAFGDVRARGGRIVAVGRAPEGGFVDTRARLAHGGAPPDRYGAADAPPNTTLAVVAVRRPLDRAALGGLVAAADVAQHRRITACGTSFDGDVVFALGPAAPAVALPPGEAVAQKSRAALALALAVERAVWLAAGRDGIPGLADG
ncbi:P1 family peptidase [Roseisolibacter sp. H3M3-2]|uniref:P1 family peptidase n=1 Tax=Roseisolibacter sp. H3M3-2 TaxID=3031323 RepID=UPI0023DC0D7E|nr:P1 family peptidase [Roseisolibacter sp. H3M3-2]MDF1505026.1 P1 family peptidase [Roseisolibacter sp. H3M3-2]